MKRIVIWAALIAALLMIIAGCGGPLSTTQDASAMLRMTSRVVLTGGITYETGVLGPGAIYEIHVPPGWENGRLVLYVHGYVSPYEQPGLPEDLDETVLAGLLQGGFAVAYSSFSETGWAVRDGAIRSRQLLGYFKDGYGDPGQVYLVGASQGGLIALMLAEQNPNLFDGLLSIQGAIGGGQLQMNYLTHVRVLFDQLYGQQLRGFAGAGDHPLAIPAQALLAALGDGMLDASPANVPPELFGALERFPEVVAALVVGDPDAPDPTVALALAAMFVDGVPLFNWDLVEILDPLFWLDPSNPGPAVFLTEMVETVATALWFNIFGTPDMLSRTNGHAMVENADAVYSSLALQPAEDLWLNTHVERVSAHPAGRNYLRNWYQPTGRLRLPMVTVHVARDPAVPILHEYAFAATAERARTSHLLVQREFSGFGHGDLRDGYGDLLINHVLAAFEDLVLWVTFGLKPES